MTKTLIALTLASAAFTATANSSAAQGGFTGPDSVKMSTVEEAKGLRDDTAIKLTGFLVKALGDDKYEFRDDTGTLVVEIDKDLWQGREIGPEQKVELRGEVDQEWNSTELDVDRLSLAE
ncbi:YgiW/YdeI family stress tolerance OB fold protein [Gallaecimonas xiamenensis]|uniref:Uncharacterized protein n=1 Tax=Gallaecimonas xiamenensis 3-C-1 TaxID=745411 RepID=K2J3V0_9GAMM|nr:NirD/YgiW/YdeI family stress tolerance protein [Gallaecimonas xiamenensis]EKE69557.1 hypothetical protein B3C1_14727 [Gallaecimonas xiamenensis 3-C-1]